MSDLVAGSVGEWWVQRTFWTTQHEFKPPALAGSETKDFLIVLPFACFVVFRLGFYLLFTLPDLKTFFAVKAVFAIYYFLVAAVLVWSRSRYPKDDATWRLLHMSRTIAGLSAFCFNGH